MNKLFFKGMFLALFVFVIGTNNTKAQEMEEVLANLTQMLDLSDKQVTQVQTLMVQYRAQLDGILLKHEDAEEPDVSGMIGEIRGVRDGYRKDLQGILSPDQYNKYIAGIDGILTDMFNDLAEIRLIDVQPEVGLTDGQLESLIPIVGKGLKSTVQLLFENAGGRLSIPKKIKIANNIKKIEKERRTAMEQILTPEQMKMYDDYKKQQKEERKNKK